MERIRLSIVQYLNSAPLAWGVLHGAQRECFDTRLSLPAQCADQLSNGMVDIGLIPSIECQRIMGSRVIEGPAVVAAGAVRSVLLIAKVPLPQVRTLATDVGSRTSVALARILLHELHGVQPSCTSVRPEIEHMLEVADAALIIGDTALRLMYRWEREARPNLIVVDLAAAWRDHTGLPFVFAVWTARAGFARSEASALLARSRDYGVERLEEIAQEYAGRLDLPLDFTLDYLRRNVSYDIGSHGFAALKLFYEKAHTLGLIPEVREIAFL